MRNLQMAYSMGLKGLSRPVVRIQSSQMLLVPTLCGSRVNSFVRNMGSRSYQQHVLTKNLTLVTTQGGLKVGKDHEVTLLSDLEKTRPLVVLLSWLLAKQKHILKFADFYLDQGFDVLTVSIQPWQMLLPARGTQVLGADLLRFLHINGCYQPLMLHGFSVGGYVWAETLVKINEDLKKYQPTIDRFVGQVWDSVADITEIPVGFPKAVFPNNPILQAATEKYVRYHMSAFHNIATCHYIRAPHGKTLVVLVAVLAVVAAAVAAPRAAVASTGPGQARARGSCPPIPQAGTQRFCGTEGCSDDSGCPSNLLCCNNGCVHVCRNPVFG